MSVNSIAIKSFLALATTGGAVFGVHQGIKALNKEEKKKVTIGNKLENIKYTLLTDTAENAQNWTTVLQSYKTVTATTPNLKFGEFNGNEPSSGTKRAIDILKEECKKALESENENLLNKTKKWCVVPISITDLLTRQKVTLLKTDKSKPQEERDKWEKKINSYKEAKKTNASLELITLSSSESEITDQNISDIKEKCINFGKIVSHNKEFEEKIEKFKVYCSEN